MGQLLEKAIAIAAAAHAGQVDKAGRPYILHPLTLMMEMVGDEEKMTAVLHDVVEDTPITFADLTAAGFPRRVLDALQLLTHQNGVSYADYIAAIAADPLATRVKAADLAHNMDIRRLAAVTAEDRRRMAKYARAAARLQQK